jgi:glycine betaine/proline transport system permease protein
MFPESLTLDIAGPVTKALDDFVARFGGGFRGLGDGVLAVLLQLEGLLRGAPWWLVVAVIAAAAYGASRRVTIAVGLAAATILLGVLGLWDAAMQSLALMIAALIVTTALGLPLGILVARHDMLRRIALPVLDAMQTLPSFVYLVPALLLFGLGKVPALLATVVYALPPIIRLTDLGLRHADPDAVEAADAFGATRTQRLLWVELPLALPSILIGLNQACMMALSMVVVAAMIGARGLGEQVLLGIQRLDTGRALVAGLAIVALAVVLDRLTQAMAKALSPDVGSGR